MPREKYQLTAATESTLSGNIKPIAAEWDKSPKYLYGILDESKNDPFAPFRSFYASCARAGVTCAFDNDLAAIRARYSAFVPTRNAIECLIEKINSNADATAKFAKALADGQIDEHEFNELESVIEKEKNTIALIEAHLSFRRGVIEAEKEKSGAKLKADISCQH